jgi:DNA-binding response OmpR family regulator
MVAPSRAAPASRSVVERATWLVLADDGAALEIGAHVTGMRVHIVADPVRFAAMLLAERPRVVVCAEPLADRATIALVATQRRRRDRMRAVHLSAPDAVEARLAVLNAGFDDALTTAMSAAELAGRLVLLDARCRPRTAAPVLPVAAGMELDLAAHELRRMGEIVHLRPKEFGLLALLAAHPGRAYSRRELLDRVWGAEHRSGIRTVDVHVRWLRSKIEPSPDQPRHLVTVRGLGYRLDAPDR